jgi:beta-lactamase regulating signal transducer with metallopeptidase domain
MSAALFLQAWCDTLVATALLVVLVLFVRKPFARHFGPRLGYALWLLPALRLLLPPLPFGDPVVVEAAPVAVVPFHSASAGAVEAPALWTFADLLPPLFALWAVGALAVLVAAMRSHARFRRDVLDDAVALEPVGAVRLVMTQAVDGPVAFGLLRRHVAVPHDFFARYAVDERALAIDHELAHHRHGDLWANAAALVLLAAQWFNPFAWRAIRAFRFDQEAACDARVLTMAGGAPRRDRTACYAAAIAKAAVGTRLSLAAPMAVQDNLQERLTMLMRQDISRRRGFAGRLLVGAAALAVLGATATLVPSGVVRAQTADTPTPPQAPAAPETEQGVTIITSTETSADAAEPERKREVRRIVIRDGEGEQDAAAPAENIRRMTVQIPGSLSRDDIIATLKEQGVDGTKAEAIADRLEARRKEKLRVAIAPVPPIPPMPPLTVSGQSIAMVRCADGSRGTPLIDSKQGADGRQRHIVMMNCGADGKAMRLLALKKARERLAGSKEAHGLSEETRVQITADLDKAIADLEKPGE